MIDLRYATIGRLRDLLDRRELSSVEIANSTCDLLEEYGRPLGAVADVTRVRALREAAAADQLIQHGSRSALLGIPYGAKDLVAARGGKTSWGAPPLANQEFVRDGTTVARLRRAGAVLAAKLAMIELAGAGGYRSAGASLNGYCRNPWNTDRWAGGSSSGSGAAVAAGLVPYALGSETNGSIRTPSAYCGVTGLRPTYGLVGRGGVMTLSWTLDKVGPIARTAEDCGRVLEVIAGRDKRDRSSTGHGFQRFDEAAAQRAIGAARIGYSGDELAHATPAARQALERGLREFLRHFPRVVEAVLPAYPYSAIANVVLSAEGAAAFGELVDSGRSRELADQRQIAGLAAAQDVTARDYLHAMRIRTVIAHDLRVMVRSADAIVSIARQNTATALDAPVDSMPAPEGASELPRGNLDLVAAGNLAGLPAIFFPCGVGTDGLPVGLQLVGRPHSEPLLLALAEDYQRRTEHHTLRPPGARLN